MNTNVMRTAIEWPAGKTIDHTLSAVKSWRNATPLRGVRQLRVSLPCSRLRVTALRKRFFAFGEVAPPSLPTLTQPGSAGRLRLHGIRLLLAALPVLAIVVGTAWTVSTFETPYVLQAVVWAVGFVFLALAMESRKPNIGALLATGLALPVLAILSARVATEFAIVAAALVAAWIAAAVLKVK